MVYKQLTDFCFGTGRLAQNDVKILLKEAESALIDLKKEAASDSLPIISLSTDNHDLAEIEGFATNIKANFDRLVILGTGGSSLCGHVLAGFMQGHNACPMPGRTQVIFMQNIDPASFNGLFNDANLHKTAFLAISKSGESVESLAQLLTCLGRAKEAGVDIKRNFFAIAMPGENTLRKIAAANGMKVYDHDPNVGGRFSILSLVGLMPGAVAGMDIRKLRKGAADFLANSAADAAETAAIHIALMRKGIWQSVMMTYPDRLEDFNIWHRQIWAESIGKNGTGSTPIKAMGTIDQHSQMQLYLAGRKDKFYSFITLDMAGDGLKISGAEEYGLGYLSGRTLGDLINAEQKATVETISAGNRPVRVIELKSLDEENLGRLIMHLMLETIITARLLGVNPYDQPAVEAGKTLTRKLMQG